MALHFCAGCGVRVPKDHLIMARTGSFVQATTAIPYCESCRSDLRQCLFCRPPGFRGWWGLCEGHTP